MVRVPLVLAAVLAALVLPASACWACSCLAADPEQYWEWADAVFDGAPTGRSDPDAQGMITWTFEVIEVWKGEVATTQQLQSHEHGATCGLSFELGVTYRVFATGHGDAMETNLCSGSAPRDQFAAGPPAQADPTEPSREPTANPTTDPTNEGDGGDGGAPPDVASEEPSVQPTATPDSDQPDAIDNVAVPAGGGSSWPVVAIGGSAGVGLLGVALWLLRRGRA